LFPEIAMLFAQRLPNPYRAEAGIVSQRLQALSQALDWAAVARLAAPWVQAVRDNPPPFWAMESLLKEYPISSAEGLALMRLAEALLRVPDAETAIALTADQLGRADFEGSSDKVLSRLSATAIAMSKHFLPSPSMDGPAAQPGLLVKLGARTVVAATLRAVQLLGRQFVLGQTMTEGLSEASAAKRRQSGLRYSYDMLGEGARTDADALAHLLSYQNAIAAIATQARTDWACEKNDGISIKLSALHPRYEYAQVERVMAELVPRVWGLCQSAAQANINLTIDAEEVERLELSLEVFESLAAQVAQHYPQWRGFGLAMQAYQTNAQELVENVIGLARKYRLRLMCRLVKGAYWDAEIKRAQELGLAHYPVFTHKHHTDISYLACAKILLDAPDAIYPQFASHNATTVAAILQLANLAPTLATATASAALPPEGAVPAWGGPAPERQVSAAQPSAGPAGADRFELQRLHGMGEGVYAEVLRNPDVACRVYAPVGAHKDLLAYLVRRLLENGANSSFVHQLADERVAMDELLVSPLHQAPHSALPLPPDLFGFQRTNSGGLDLTVPSMRDPLLAAYAKTQVPQVALFDAAQAAQAVASSAGAYPAWNQLPVGSRAQVLRQAADALQAELPRFCALLVKEAFKTWNDAIGEVREAIDFLRYYAAQAETILQPKVLPGFEGDVLLGITGESNELSLGGRGPWVCISPWNFPLAIFMGQVAAALVTGNSVLAKPAEQTPGVALEAVKLLHAAGVPVGVLQLLHGPGESVGAALVAAPGVAGVVFTGSTVVAKHINRALAAKDGPIIPLIAETGGINAMLVDSTALPEQVCDAVMQSAFRSAGQRCSALRLLCLHEEIADHVTGMIVGAARELVVGDPADLATDVSPVIDADAYAGIQSQLARLNVEAKSWLVSAAPDPAVAGALANLIAPQIFEIADISDLKQEIFGPVLHIVRWRGDPLKVIAQINALGYGLTIGIQTRIDSRARQLARAAHIGNVYINRNQIGAVVGVQPFGGEGLSGTGPKAGGPHYLLRFCSEKTVTINTTAAGGNAALLAG
jgi:RHH-type proline utilization regulon transcriptional repressor/proline dehydrogenase/delta 1-pyrroline-5-carboxylate dehydrogenase